MILNLRWRTFATSNIWIYDDKLERWMASRSTRHRLHCCQVATSFWTFVWLVMAWNASMILVLRCFLLKNWKSKLRNCFNSDSEFVLKFELPPRCDVELKNSFLLLHVDVQSEIENSNMAIELEHCPGCLRVKSQLAHSSSSLKLPLSYGLWKSWVSSCLSLTPACISIRPNVATIHSNSLSCNCDFELWNETKSRDKKKRTWSSNASGVAAANRNASPFFHGKRQLQKTRCLEINIGQILMIR